MRSLVRLGATRQACRFISTMAMLQKKPLPVWERLFIEQIVCLLFYEQTLPKLATLVRPDPC